MNTRHGDSIVSREDSFIDIFIYSIDAIEKYFVPSKIIISIHPSDLKNINLNQLEMRINSEIDKRNKLI